MSELVPMKRGRPLLIGDELDRQVGEYILDTRRVGGDINTAVVIAGGTGIMMSQNPSLLKGMKDGKLTKDWAKYVLQCMGFVKRKATTKVKINVQDFVEIKKLFLLDVSNVVKMNEICEEMIVNWDQMGINYVPVPS